MRFAAGVGALALGLVVVTLVLAPTAQTTDAVEYALAARDLDRIHPHHPAFLPALHVFNRLGLGPLLAGQVHNALWGALGVGAFAWVARQRADAVTALGVTAAWVACRAVLADTGQVLPYAAPIAASAVVAALAVREERSGPALTALGAAWTVGVAYHQALAMLGVPLLVLAWLRRDRALAAVVPAVGAACLLLWGAAWALAPDEPRGFVSWTMAYAVVPTHGWGAWGSPVPVVGAWARNLVEAPRWGLLGVAAAIAGWVAWGGRRLDPTRAFFVAWIAVWLVLQWWWQPSMRLLAQLALVPLFGLLLEFRWGGWAVAAVALPVNLVGTVWPDHMAGLPGEALADRVERVADGCVALVPRDAMVVLRLRGREAAPIDAVRATRYLDHDRGHWPERLAGRCVVVDPAELDPGLVVPLRSGEVNGASDPVGWARFVGLVTQDRAPTEVDGLWRLDGPADPDGLRAAWRRALPGSPP